MEAKDTILTNEQIFNLLPGYYDSLKFIWESNPEHDVKATLYAAPEYRIICKEQAETSWKAREPEIQEAHKAGMKEVVEWIKANADLERGDRDVGLCFEDYLWFDYHNWQAKLKEWGL